MKSTIALAIFALTLSSANADALSDADREALLANLEKLRSDADSRVDAKFRVALTAYRAAMTDDDQAMDLYLKCVEKVNYSDRDLKSKDFREWKRRESDQLAAPAFRTALRYQLSWLVLTLQAAAEKPDMPRLQSEAESILDSIFRNAEDLASQQQLLGQDVLGSIFAQAYEITRVEVENWPLAPAQLGEIYEKIIFPTHRNPEQTASLQASWTKRIQQEIAKREFWDSKNGRESPEFEQFVTEIVPQLQWSMEKDLFTNGDQSAAAMRMLTLIEKNLSHPNAREWAEQFKALLTPKPTP